MRPVWIILTAAALVMTGCADQTPFAAKIGPACGEHWQVPSNPMARIAAARLPALPKESLTYHADVRLSVVTNGTKQLVPAGIGIAASQARISPLHTHYCDGVVHGESGKSISMYLSQFFIEWGVALTSECIGEFCEPQGVKVIVDGREIAVCPGAVEIVNRRSIELILGRVGV